MKNRDVHVVSASDEENKVLIRVQAEQRKDGELSQIINYLEGKSLPKDAAEAKKTVIAANQGYFLVDGILYYESSDSPRRRRLVVPQHLWKDMIQCMQDISLLRN